MSLNIDNSNFIEVKGFLNPKSKDIILVLVPNDGELQLLDFDKNDNMNLIRILGSNSITPLHLGEEASGLGSKAQVEVFIDSLKPGFRALGYNIISTIESFITDERILKLKW